MKTNISVGVLGINRNSTNSNIGGTQCIIVSSFSTPEENGTALQAAYNDAKLKTPSANNVITIVATPGTYKFPEDGFTMDTPYINLVSLDGNRSVIFDVNRIEPFEMYYDLYANHVPYIVSYCLNITTDNVHVKGIKGAVRSSDNYLLYGPEESDVYQLPISLSSDSTNVVIENCEGGFSSFSNLSLESVYFLSSTLINCKGGYNSFAGNMLSSYTGYESGAYAEGTFIDCKAEDKSFGLVASGVFTNCKGASYCFGIGQGFFPGTASGTFTDCKANQKTFGNFATGNFINCKSDEYSFGGALYIFDIDPDTNEPLYYTGQANGKFINCTATYYSFGGASAGTFIDCKASDNSFSSGNIASGTYIRCIGKNSCFGSDSTSLASGTFIDCIGGYASFGGNDSFGATGVFTNCQGLAYSFAGYAPASGTFINCQGGDHSFGGDGLIASGTFINCKGGYGSFAAFGTASGIFENCIGEESSFGGNGIAASGTFTNCKGTNFAFGSGVGNIASGIFTNCTGDDFCFGSEGGVASGQFNDCIGGVYSFGGEGIASGAFTNCTGGNNSFAKGLLYDVISEDYVDAVLSGKLYYCRLILGTFQTVSGTGRTIYCIDGNNNPNNQ